MIKTERTTTLEINSTREIPLLYNEGDVLWIVSDFCDWWHLKEDHNEDLYTYISPSYYSDQNRKIKYRNFRDAERYLNLKPKYKYYKAKVKRIIEEKYVDVIVWNNYWVRKESIPYIINDYLKLIKK